MKEPTIGGVDRKAVKSLMFELEEEACGNIVPVTCPWPEMQEATGGFRQGEITVIAGTEGSGKSYLVLWLAMHMQEMGRSWLYMPLEDTPKDFLRRFLAMKTKRWNAVERGKEHSFRTAQTLVQHAEYFQDLQNHICKNPRTAVKYYGFEGEDMAPLEKKYAPDLPYKKMLDEFIEPNIKCCDVIFIDPITLMDYDKSHNSEDNRCLKEYEGQHKFVNQLISLVQGSTCHVVLVLHMTKDGKAVQGAAAFTRFVHNVIYFQAHDRIKSDVVRTTMDYADAVEVTHKRTMTVKKSRNGKGNGWRIAYDFEQGSPTLSEYGVIVPEIKR